ncbi:MAG: DUF2255 family protein, partial [Microbacteriaceae bacterium]|nr:DUF2255 family protein [Microbacteriaceae bacterium]
LEALAERAEIEVATTLRDGSPGWVPFWVVRVGEGLFARTHREPPATWWREATAAGTTRLRLAPGEPEHAFLVTVVGDMLRPEIDAAYRARFTGDDAQYVPGICSESAVARTVRFRLAPD